jgi:hypothetical protein
MHFTPAIVLGLLVCVVVAIIPAVRNLLAQRPRPHDGDENGPLDGPWLRSGPDGPAWWPEFERDFARYVAVRDAARRANGPADL